MSKLEHLQKNALIIFVKVPRLSEVKTRLQPELSLEDSLDLHKAMAEDLLNNLSHSDKYSLFIQYWPDTGLAEMQKWFGNNFKYKKQQGSDLGEKLKNAFSEAFENFKKVCIIGSDLPLLSDKDILESFDKLEIADVVLGPSTDGGYYMVALKKYQPLIFQGIDWSTEFVFRQTLDKIKQQNLSVERLPLREDIDSYHDVIGLWNNITAGGNNIVKDIPRTFDILKKIFNEKLQGN